jgi:hypothetical protein
MNLSEQLRQHADAKGIPQRTVDDVREALTEARKVGSDAIFKRLMLNHGRLTAEARAFVEAWS